MRPKGVRQNSTNWANEPVPQPKRNFVPHSTALRAQVLRPAGRFGVRRASAAFSLARAFYLGNYTPASPSSEQTQSARRNSSPTPAQKPPPGRDRPAGREWLSGNQFPTRPPARPPKGAEPAARPMIEAAGACGGLPAAVARLMRKPKSRFCRINLASMTGLWLHGLRGLQGGQGAWGAGIAWDTQVVWVAGTAWVARGAGVGSRMGAVGAITSH